MFVEIALTDQLSTSIHPLIDPTARVGDPCRARCAVFYSITNCHDGLKGVSFGGDLIHRVADDVSSELPKIRRFATLSPIPSFVSWLQERTRPRLPACSPVLARWLDESTTDKTVRPLPEILRLEVCQLGAYYLLHAKRGARPFDPVARFHLANGARLERLNWLADTSGPALRRSLGLMANYEYRTEVDMLRNRRRYSVDNEVVASRSVRWLAEHARSRTAPTRADPAQ
jgi:malonyl-CoA decarboxylase